MTRREFAASVALAPATVRPNIVLILADDLGYGDLGCYGSPVPTPNLDRLAAEGVRFTQAYVASPICSPSRVGITTGQCPSRHGIYSYLDSRQKNREFGMRDFLDPKAPSLARTLRQAGYATGHFGKWHMGGGRDVDDAPLPGAYGFDESLTTFEGLGDRLLTPGRLSDMSAKLGQGNITRVPQHMATEMFVDRTLEFVRSQAAKPFYVQLWPNDVHDPFAPKPELLAKYRRFENNKYLQQYYATLDEMDRQIGRVVDEVERLGLGERTLFVFVGDNGPTAWPRYYKEGFEPPGSTGGYRGRKWSLYEGGIREPMIARWKGRVPAGRTSDALLSTLDLFPTFCRLAGVAPPAVAFDGEDASAAFSGRKWSRRKELFWEYGRDERYLFPGEASDRSPNLAMRAGRWKMLMNADGSKRELYDFARSDKERDNLAERHPKVADSMAERLLAWRRSLL